MPKMECRESRPVFRSKGEVWQAAAAGVVTSHDLDQNGRLRTDMPLSPFQLQRAPSIPQIMPFSPTHLLPPPTPPKRQALQPLGNNNVNIKVLQNEVQKLERETASLKKLVQVQGRVIDGFCQLRIAERQP
jgi:hypothetical protein